MLNYVRFPFVKSGRSDQSVLKWDARVLGTGSGHNGPAHGFEPLSRFTRSGRPKRGNLGVCNQIYSTGQMESDPQLGECSYESLSILPSSYCSSQNRYGVRFINTIHNKLFYNNFIMYILYKINYLKLLH